GEDRTAISIDQLNRGGANADQRVVRPGEVQMKAAVLALRADIGIELANPRRRQLPEAVVIIGAGSDIGADVADLVAVLRGELSPAERAPGRFGLTPLEVKAVL